MTLRWCENWKIKLKCWKKKNEILRQKVDKTDDFLAILKRNVNQKRRLGGDPPLAKEMCPIVTMNDVSQYEKNKELFCTNFLIGWIYV